MEMAQDVTCWVFVLSFLVLIRISNSVSQSDVNITSSGIGTRCFFIYFDL